MQDPVNIPSLGIGGQGEACATDGAKDLFLSVCLVWLFVWLFGLFVLGDLQDDNQSQSRSGGSSSLHGEGFEFIPCAPEAPENLLCT